MNCDGCDSELARGEGHLSFNTPFGSVCDSCRSFYTEYGRLPGENEGRRAQTTLFQERQSTEERDA